MQNFPLLCVVHEYFVIHSHSNELIWYMPFFPSAKMKISSHFTIMLPPFVSIVFQLTVEYDTEAQ